MLQVDERADFVASEGETFAQGGVAFVERDHFFCNFIQALLAAFHLARHGAFADEPASVDLRVDVAVGVVTADEALTSDGSAMVTEFFEAFTFDVVAEEQVDEGAGSGVRGGDFG